MDPQAFDRQNPLRGQLTCQRCGLCQAGITAVLGEGPATAHHAHRRGPRRPGGRLRPPLVGAAAAARPHGGCWG